LFDICPGIDKDLDATDDRIAVAGGPTKLSASTAAFSFSARGVLLVATGFTLWF
jgi:DNA-binding transcriptional regulator LsrR (DeoR family)